MEFLQEIRELINPEGITDERIIAAQKSFWSYCQLMNPKFYRDERIYLRELCDTLQGIFEGTLINPETGKPYKKLMINLPPRHGKSYTVTLFNQWILGKNNETRTISVSYNDDLSVRFAKQVRDGISADKVDNSRMIFRDVFPSTEVKHGDASAKIWSLEGQFFSFLATGFGGTMTGFGATTGIIDDPIKNNIEAFNDRVLDEQWAWYTDTFLSRIEEGGIQIIIMTRWSTKDLCGRLLESDEAEEWYVFCRQVHNATPAVIGSAPGLTSTEFERFEGKWNEKFRGIGNSHKFGLVPRELAIHKLTESQKEMDFANSRKDIRDAVMAHFGIPPEIMGVVENSNRATATQAKIIYAENVLKPRIDARQDDINIQLLPYWGDDLLFEYDDIVPEDNEFKLEVANAGIAHGTMMLDEWREEMDKEPLDNDKGKVFMLPYSVTPTTPEELTQSPRENVNMTSYFSEQKQEKARGSTGPRSAAKLQAHEEATFERAILHYFGNQYRAISTVLEKGKKDDAPDIFARLMQDGITLDIVGLRQLAASALDELIDWSQQADELAAVLSPLWQQAFEDGATHCETAFGIKAIQAPRLTDRLRREGLKRVEHITDTTKEQLANALADGIEAGESQEQLIKRVREHIPDIQRERAEAIAITESHTSIMEGTMGQMEYAGIQTKRWRTAGDEATRPTHAALDGMVVGIHERFPNGCRYPGDPEGEPGEIIRCRCTLEPGDF